MKAGLFVAISILLLVACGSERPTAQVSAPGRTPFISGVTTGAVSSEFALSGAFKCQHDGLDMTAEIIGTGAGSVEQLTIAVPYVLAGVGTYDLIGTADNPVMNKGRFEIRYRSADRQTFDRGTGILTITQWPQDSRGQVSGTVQAALTDGTGMVRVEGVISGAPIYDAFDCSG